MSLDVDVVQEDGLSRLLEKEVEPDDTRLREAVEEFLTTPGVEGTPGEEGLNATLRAVDESTAEATGWWEALKSWWREEEHEVVGTEECMVELAAYWLTVPRGTPDVAVEMSSSSSESKGVSASFAIAGIGGGPSFTVTLKEAVTFETGTNERASLETKGTFEKVNVIKHGQVISSYMRLKSIDQNNFTWNREPEDPPVGAALGSKTGSEKFEFTRAGGPGSKTIAVARGTTWELEAGFKAFGIDVKLGGKVTYEQEVEYKYTLPKGKDYVADRYSDFPALIWDER